jgi:hypothetical protein
MTVVLRCTVGSETRDLRAGDFMSTPRGEVNAFSNPHARRGAGAHDPHTGHRSAVLPRSGIDHQYQERHSTDDCWRMHLYRCPQHAEDRRYAVASLKAAPMPATSSPAQPSCRSSTRKFDRPLSKVTNDSFQSEAAESPSVLLYSKWRSQIDSGKTMGGFKSEVQQS